MTADDMGDDEECPRCDKCGAEVTTGLMAAICPAGRECEFWTPELEAWMTHCQGEQQP